MKNIFKISSLLLLLCAMAFWGCKKDDIEPSLEAIGIVDNDVIQLTNDRNYVPVVISASDNKGISSVVVKIIPDGKTDAVASNTLKSITNSDLNRFTVNVPFPLPEVAPNGKYNVEYTIEDTKGNKTTKSYKINVVNNQVKTCTFTKNEPSGSNNLIVQLTLTEAIVASTTGDLYITGSFEGWTGGDETKSQYKFTKVSNTCYYVEVNMPAGAEFKITRGEWDNERLEADGSTPGNIKYNSEKVIKITAYNWKDKTLIKQAVPLALPFEAIQSGKITTIVDIGTSDDASKYYLVKKGATSLTDAISLYRVAGTTKVAGAVPSGSTDEFVVVKGDATKIGVNGFGFDVLIKLTSSANSFTVNSKIAGFKPDYSVSITSLLLVGGSTPAGWDNSVGNPQVFTKVSDGKFTITINLDKTRPDPGILFISKVTDWSDNSKIGKYSGNATTGTLGFGGGNYDTPDVAGNYKIDVDFITGTYTFTKQ